MQAGTSTPEGSRATAGRFSAPAQIMELRKKSTPRLAPSNLSWQVAGSSAFTVVCGRRCTGPSTQFGRPASTQAQDCGWCKGARENTNWLLQACHSLVAHAVLPPFSRQRTSCRTGGGL